MYITTYVGFFSLLSLFYCYIHTNTYYNIFTVNFNLLFEYTQLYKQLFLMF